MASTTPNLDHPTLPHVKNAFPDARLRATEFRGQTTLIVEPSDQGSILRFLKDDPNCDYNFMVDATAADYLGYPSEMPGRFAVIYVLRSFKHELDLTVKVFLDPTVDTSGVEEDPALEVESVCGLWSAAEWREREIFDMYGIRFRNHPDLRRLLTWTDFPAHPLRKDYPLRGRGERELYRVIDRTES